MSAVQAITAYEDLAESVFSETKMKGKDGTFKASKLETAVKSVVESKLGPGQANARMWEEDVSDSCRA